MDAALVRCFRVECCDFIARLELEPALKMPQLIDTFDAGPSEAQLEKYEKLLSKALEEKHFLNPKKWRECFVKMDALYSYDLSGEVTYGARAAWAKANADPAHALWSFVVKALKRNSKNSSQPRSSVLRRLCSKYGHRLVNTPGSPRSSTPLKSSRSSDSLDSLVFPMIPGELLDTEDAADEDDLASFVSQESPKELVNNKDGDDDFLFLGLEQAEGTPAAVSAPSSPAVSAPSSLAISAPSSLAATGSEKPSKH